MKMEPGKKRAIRKMIRTAIKFQNNRTLFSCRDCCFDSDTGCDFNETSTVVYAQRMPHQLPECFLIDPLGTAFVGCLDLMLKLGVDSFKSHRGWGTVVGRLISRANSYGYIINIKQRNLNRYG